MWKIVLGTNIIVSILSKRSQFHSIYHHLISGSFSLFLNNDILLEYEEIMQQKYGEGNCSMFLNLLSELPNVIYSHNFYEWRLIQKDQDDNKFVDCAINNGCDYIVTEDSHFDILQKIDFPIVKVINTQTFSELLNNTAQ